MATLTLKKKTPASYCDQWLHTFPAFQKHQLLKIGIDKDLKEEFKKEERSFPFSKVRFQIRRRVRKPWYQKLLEKRDTNPRFSLDGSEWKMEK